MTGISAVEIAKRQRYLLLLQKVKENKTLSRAELDELKRYERQAAGSISAKARMTSTKPSKARRKKKIPATPKRGSKKIRKAKRVRLPVDEAEVRRLGLECENLTEADAAIKKSQTPTVYEAKNQQRGEKVLLHNIDIIWFLKNDDMQS